MKHKYIWQGVLDWQELVNPDNRDSRLIPCKIFSLDVYIPDLQVQYWPGKMIMKLFPRGFMKCATSFLKDSKYVVLRPPYTSDVEKLANILTSQMVGVVNVLPTSRECDIRCLIVMYVAGKRAFVGFAPNSQRSFVDRLTEETGKLMNLGPNNPVTRLALLGKSGESGGAEEGRKAPSSDPCSSRNTLPDMHF